MKFYLLPLFLCIPSWILAQCGACEHPVQLIENGNFSSGNTGFSTDLTLGTGFFCPLCPEGTYAVGSNAIFFHNNFTGNDHTNPPTGNFFIANGLGAIDLGVWCQTVAVQPNTQYTFTYWARDVANNTDPHPLAHLIVNFNGIATPDTLVAEGGWSQMQISWNSGSLTSVQICISNIQTQTGGNDFGLDDISLTACHAYTLAYSADAGPDAVGCSGDSIGIGALPHAGYNYSWDNTAGLSANQAANPDVTITINDYTTITETYILTVDSANVGCVTTDTVIVTIAPMPPFSLGADLLLCPGESATLDAGAGWDNVEWSTLNGPFSSSQNVVVNSSDTYSALVQLGNCQRTDDVLVTLVVLPAIDLGNDQQICEGDTTTLFAQAVGLWSTGVSALQMDVSEEGEYFYTYTQQGCSVEDSVFVEVFALPVVLISAPDTLCEGSPQTLTSDTYGLWNTGDFGTTTIANNGGYYGITVTNGPCQTTMGVNIAEIALPIAYLGPDTLICEGEPLLLDAFAVQNQSYLWSNGDTTYTLFANTEGIYEVVVSNACGSSSSSILISTETCGWEVFIPNCFSPNLDGINEGWSVQGYNVSDLSIYVYNRLGDLIFHGARLGEEWRPGIGVGDDIYNYLITGIDNIGKPFKREGFVMLQR